MHSYLFVLCPPYCGSTVLWRLLSTSPVVSAHPTEGQSLEEVKHIIWEGPKPWDPRKVIPWAEVRQGWERVWDMSKSILLEKSPPHIVWALEIEKAFTPAYFIAMMRDPYAFCEGRRRRHPESHIKVSAEFWADCANYQIRNIERLERITFFRYEDFAERPMDIRSQILDFMSELEDIDITKSFKARSIGRSRELAIQNLNREKIDRLSTRDIRDVNSVLRRHDHLMDYFGYGYLEPNFGHSLRFFKATAASHASVALHKTKRFSAHLLTRRRAPS